MLFNSTDDNDDDDIRTDNSPGTFIIFRTSAYSPNYSTLECFDTACITAWRMLSRQNLIQVVISNSWNSQICFNRCKSTFNVQLRSSCRYTMCVCVCVSWYQAILSLLFRYCFQYEMKWIERQSASNPTYSKYLGNKFEIIWSERNSLCLCLDF